MRNALLLFVACALSGIAVPLPEDLPLLAAGTALDGPAAFGLACIAGVLGVLVRDGVFYGVGRFAGERALRWWVLRRWFGEERLERGRQLVNDRGGRAVLAARFLVGFRSAGFLVAGAMGVRVRDFLLWDLVGAVVSVPVLLGLGVVLGGPVTAAITWILDHRMLVLGLGALVGLAWMTSQQQRRASGLDDTEAVPS